MGKFGKFLSELFFPTQFTCDLCGIETFGANLCKDCLKTVAFNNNITCPVCGRRTARNEICYECKDHAPYFTMAVSPLVYEGGSIKLIVKFKNGEGYLKEYFADLIYKILPDFIKFDYIVYVPMTKTAERKRGYNQAELLAKSLSERSGIPILKNALVKLKETAEQKTLTFKQRAENLKGCFKAENRAEIKNKTLLLVDDVLTTGATSEAICKILLKAGAKQIVFATVASVEYKIENNDNQFN